MNRDTVEKHSHTTTNAEQSVLTYTIDDACYINLGRRCTLRCEFCPKTHGDFQLHEYDLFMQRPPSAREIIDQLPEPENYREVVFCGYGEPTLRLKVLLEVAQHVKQHGGRVRLNTDGLGSLVHGRNIVPELVGLVDAVSVSMNAQSEKVYQRHCQPQLPGSFAAMQSFIRNASLQLNQVTATAINGLEGVDLGACEKLAQSLGAKFRVRELDVLG